MKGLKMCIPFLQIFYTWRFFSKLRLKENQNKKTPPGTCQQSSSWLNTSTEAGTGSAPGQGAKIPHAAQSSQKVKKKNPQNITPLYFDTI